MKDINKMTRKEFDELPYRESWDKDVECYSIIILPQRKLHDSGYRLIDAVAVGDDDNLIRVAGCSDVIHLDGIGGYGFNWVEKNQGVPHLIPVSGWSIDILAVSGLIRLWPHSKKIRIGCALSSLEIFAIDKEVKKDG